jgi:hypothetical protein
MFSRYRASLHYVQLEISTNFYNTMYIKINGYIFHKGTKLWLAMSNGAFLFALLGYYRKWPNEI